MFRPRYIIPAVLIAVLLLIGEIAVIRGATEYEAEADVVFSSVNIPEGTIITEDMLETRSIDAGMKHKMSFGKKQELVGKTACADIEQGEMILNTRVADLHHVGGIPVLNPESRLFTVEFRADQANGWQLKAGDYVDIIFIPQNRYGQGGGLIDAQADNGGTNGFYGVAYRLEKVRIAALIDDAGNLTDTGKKGSLPRYISFEVNKGQDEFLAYAKANGRLELSALPYSWKQH